MCRRTQTGKGLIARRAQWSHPSGLKLVAEYWLSTDTAKLISVAEGDDYAALIAATPQWDDVFSFTVIPACTAKEGPEIVKQLMR